MHLSFKVDGSHSDINFSSKSHFCAGIVDNPNLFNTNFPIKTNKFIWNANLLTGFYIIFYLIGIHSSQSWTVTTKHEVTRERERQRWKTYKEADQKKSKDKRCLLSLDLMPFRSSVKGRHSAEFQSVAMRRTESPTKIISSAICSDELLQSHTYRKKLTWLHFNDEPNVQEKQQVKDQQPYTPVSIAYPTYWSSSGGWKYQPRHDTSINHCWNVVT